MKSQKKRVFPKISISKSTKSKSKNKKKKNTFKRKQIGGQINVNIDGSERSLNSISELYAILFSSAQPVSEYPILILNQQVQISFLPCYKFTGIIEKEGNPNNGLSGICFLEKSFQTNNYQDCVRLIYSQGEDIIDTKFNKCLLDKIYPNNLTKVEHLLFDEVIKSLESKRRDKITNQQLRIISLEDENKRLEQENEDFDIKNNKCKQECQSRLEQKSQECKQQEQLKLKQESQRYEQQQLMQNKERKEKIKQIIEKVRLFVNGLEDEIEEKDIEIEKKENEIEKKVKEIEEKENEIQELKKKYIDDRSVVQELKNDEENTYIKKNIEEIEKKKKAKERLQKRLEAKLERKRKLSLTLGKEDDEQDAVAP